MAKFFVGQMFRVVAGDWRIPETTLLVGREGRIVGVQELWPGVDFWVTDIQKWSVRKDLANTFLEPILPSGHRASEYSLTELLDRCRAGEGVAA